MSAPQNVPPWLREQLQKFQMTQQNLQTILAQKQQIEIERAEIDKALEELEKSSDTDAVFKHAGSILVQSRSASTIDLKVAGSILVQSSKSASTIDLKERRELAGTRITVTEKQEKRLRESLKEQDTKINEMVSGKKDMNSPPPPPPPNKI